MTDEQSTKCPLCEETAQAQQWGQFDAKVYQCGGCGRFILGFMTEEYLNSAPADLRFKLACLLREKRSLKQDSIIGLFSSSDFRGTPLGDSVSEACEIKELLRQFPAATQMMDRALLNLSRLLDHPMREFELASGMLQYLLFCPGNLSLTLLRHMEQMELLGKLTLTRSGASGIITPGGWTRIEELSRVAVDSRQAFVAMWFDPSRESLYKDGIEPAVAEAGYVCRRIDKKETLNKICDEIVAEIRKSKFIIADFTGQRGGVYFEAGYAMGLGLPVIWVVQESDVENLHFDTRQYRHIVYQTAEELRIGLLNCIAANIH